MASRTARAYLSRASRPREDVGSTFAIVVSADRPAIADSDVRLLTGVVAHPDLEGARRRCGRAEGDRGQRSRASFGLGYVPMSSTRWLAVLASLCELSDPVPLFISIGNWASPGLFNS